MTELVKDFEIQSTGLNSTHKVIEVNVKSNFLSRDKDYGEHTYSLECTGDMLIISELENGGKNVLHIITPPFHIMVCDNITK